MQTEGFPDKVSKFFLQVAPQLAPPTPFLDPKINLLTPSWIILSTLKECLWARFPASKPNHCSYKAPESSKPRPRPWSLKSVRTLGLNQSHGRQERRAVDWALVQGWHADCARRCWPRSPTGCSTEQNALQELRHRDAEGPASYQGISCQCQKCIYTCWATRKSRGWLVLDGITEILFRALEVRWSFSHPTCSVWV